MAFDPDHAENVVKDAEYMIVGGKIYRILTVVEDMFHDYFVEVSPLYGRFEVTKLKFDPKTLVEQLWADPDDVPLGSVRQPEMSGDW